MLSILATAIFAFLIKMVHKQKTKVLVISHDHSVNLKVDFIRKTFNIDSLIDSVSFVQLEGCPDGIEKIERLEFSASRIFLLNSDHNKIYAFDINGKFKYLISQTPIDNFQIIKNKLATFDHEEGRFNFYTLDGKFLYKINIGLESLDCMAISDSTYICYTAGLKLKDNGQKQHEFTILDQTSKITGYLLPVPQERVDADYYPGRRLYSVGSKIYFIPTFNTTLNSISSKGAHQILRLDYGNYGPSEDDLASILGAGNLYIFPYIFDSQLLAETEKHRFYTFVYKSEKGYLIEDKDAHQITAGIGLSSGKSAGFNDIMPI